MNSEMISYAINFVDDEIIESADVMRKKVEDKAAPKSRTRKIKRTIILVAILTLALLATAWAVSNSEILKVFFQGYFSDVESSVNTVYESVSDSRFKLSIEESLALDNSMLIIFSVEGLTDEAVEELMREGNEPFFDMDCISFLQLEDPSRLRYGGASLGEVIERRTDTQKVMACSITRIDNPDKHSLYMRLNKMSDASLTIEIPTYNSLETIELVLPNQPYGEAVLELSPIDLIFRCREWWDNDDDTDGLMSYAGLFFRMKNGEVMTLNQLAQSSSRKNIEEYTEETFYEDYVGYLNYEYYTMFREVTDLSDIKSVIVGELEYDVKNPTNPKTVELDTHLYPFEIKKFICEYEGWWIDIFTICEKLGAKIHWDEREMSATVKFRGKEIKYIEGNDSYWVNGQEHILYDGVPMFLDGVFIIPPSEFCEEFHLETQNTRLTNTLDRDEIIWMMIP